MATATPQQRDASAVVFLGLVFILCEMQIGLQKVRNDTYRSGVLPGGTTAPAVLRAVLTP